MAPRILPTDAPEELARAAAEGGALLAAGGLVAFPTETVYGLGANALDPAAIARLYAAKGRPSHNPLIVHVADADAAARLAAEWPRAAARLAERHWPGPLTLVVRKASMVPDVVTAGLDRVAIRVPAHPVAAAVLAAAAVPVAAPSANRSGGVSPTTAAHVTAGLGDRVDLVLDGGPTAVGIESTVLDLTTDPPVLLRPGMITREQLAAVLGSDVAIATPVVEGAPRRSPGMLDRHYAPDAHVDLVRGTPAALAAATERIAQGGRRVGVLTWSGGPLPGTALVQLMPADPEGYARDLYAALHRLDRRCEVIVIEDVPDRPEWEGIRDRLRRASAADAPA